MDFLVDFFKKIIGMQPVGGDIPPTIEATVLHRPGESCRLGLDVPKVRSVKSLTSGQPLAFTWTDGELAFTVDRLGAFEAILIEGED